MTLCRDAFTKYSLVEPTSSLCTAEGNKQATRHHLTGRGKSLNKGRPRYVRHTFMQASGIPLPLIPRTISPALLDKEGGNVLQMCGTIFITNVCQTSSCKHQSCDAESQGFGLKPVTVLVDPPVGGGASYLCTVSAQLCAHTYTRMQTLRLKHTGREHSDRLCDWNFYARRRDLSPFNLLTYLTQ